MISDLLRLRAFRLYIASILVSFVGNLCYLTATTWLVLQMTGMTWLVPALFLVSAVPGVVFAPVVARLVERFDRRRLLIVVDTLSGLVVLLGPLTDAFGLLTPAQLFVQEFVVAFGGALFFTTSRSFVREIVPPDRLLSANSMLIGVFATGNTLGALAGGVLVQVVSPSFAMTVNGLSFFLSAAGILAVRATERRPAPPVTTAVAARGPLALWSDFATMAARVLRSPQLQVFFVLFLAIAGLQRFLLGVLQPFVVVDLDSGPLGFGIIQAALAVGAFAGGDLVPRLVERWGRRPTLVGLVGATVPLVCLFGASPHVAVAAAIYFFLGLLTQVQAIAQTSIQEHEDDGSSDASRLALLNMMQSVAVLLTFAVTTGMAALLTTRSTYLAFGLIYALIVARPLFLLVVRRESVRI